MPAPLPAPFSKAAPDRLRIIDYVLTDMDDTLTHQGRLPADSFTAMSRLRDAGIKVIPVTAAPAGWCDQMVRMWPVDAVIGENGGLYFHAATDKPVPDTVFWHDHDVLAANKARLETIQRSVQSALPDVDVAADQPFRLTSLAFNVPREQSRRDRLVGMLQASGCSTTVNNLWVLAWIGQYTKLEMSRRLLAERFGLNLDDQGKRLIYAGDSLNDEPMFRALPNSVGVSTVADYLPQMRHGPVWITENPGGFGFAEMAAALLLARSR
ncbi:MAG TPA: HAD hydrolase family protein [Candidatus Sulfotelmatobacter sp.]|nr:HAD hydrolase family protein [Candidatus Sulfotelmatobacter sp.]